MPLLKRVYTPKFFVIKADRTEYILLRIKSIRKEVAFMEITLEKQTVVTENILSEEVLEQAIDNEIMLPDFCSSVGRILKCLARAKIISKRIVNSVLGVDGNVFLTVFYIDEQGALKSFEQTLSFYRELNLKKETDISADVDCKIEHITCRKIGPRKIEIHGSLSVFVELSEMCRKECVKDAKTDDIQLKTEKRSVTVPIACTEKYMAINDEIELPADEGSVTGILRSFGRIEYADCKAIAGKVIVKGEVLCTVCYTTEESERISQIDSAIPFTQIVDCEKCDEQCFARAFCDITALDIRSKTGFNGEVQGFSVSAGINSRIRVYKNVEGEFAVDAYSVKYNTETKSDRITLFRNLADLKEDFSHKFTVDFGTDINAIIDIFGNATVTDVKKGSDRTVINGTVQICIIACDGDRSVNCFERSADFSHTVLQNTYGENVCIQPEIDVRNICFDLSGSSAEVTVNMSVRGSVENRFELSVLSDIVICEQDEQSGDKPALTLYYAYEDENIFDISRRYRAAVNSVKKANCLEDETVLKGSVILIPGM